MAITTFCDEGRGCEYEPETFGVMMGGGFEPVGGCFEPAEPHSTLCEAHGGEAETESFLEEWELHISTAEEICTHIDDGQDNEKIAAFLSEGGK